MKLYPLKFRPIIKERIWGGNRLKTLLNKDVQGIENSGESWELSCVKDNVSIIANGSLAGMALDEAIEKYKEELVGDIYRECGKDFPLLIKFIDAQDDLSVQVHPDDALAHEVHNCKGKTEMWVVMEAEKGSKLISGFKQKTDPNDYKRLLDTGEFLDRLCATEVKRGDAIFVPAGRIHAIGKGIVIAEIQQTSDVTYRVYDYKRRDKNGNERELHVDLAQRAINFEDLDSGFCNYQPVDKRRVEVVECPYFKTGFLKLSGNLTRDYSAERNCVILICISGSGEVDGVTFSRGTTLLVPAVTEKMEIRTEGCEFIEVLVP